MIHRLRVQNFKSILDVTVELSPVTVLVGRSGTGKSNLVQSLRYLRDTLLGSGEQVPFVQLQPAFVPETSMRFEVEFSVGGINDRYSYEIAFGKHGPDQPPLLERLNLGQTCLFHQVTKEGRSSEWRVKPELVQVPPAGPIALGRIPSVSEVVIAFTALTTGIGCYVFPDAVLSGRGSRGESSDGLDDHATNYLDVLKEIISDLQNLNSRRGMLAAVQRVNSSISAIELDDIRRPSHVVVGHKFDGKTLSLQLAQESDGLRRFYAHLLALYQRPPKQTLIFEHPEDGIHPGALALLAEEFMNAPQQGRGQVILTTHSPKLLDQFDVNEIRVVELQGLQTRIGPLSAEQRDAIHDHLLDAGELLTVDPARMQPEAAGK